MCGPTLPPAPAIDHSYTCQAPTTAVLFPFLVTRFVGGRAHARRFNISCPCPCPCAYVCPCACPMFLSLPLLGCLPHWCCRGPCHLWEECGCDRAPSAKGIDDIKRIMHRVFNGFKRSRGSSGEGFQGGQVVKRVKGQGGSRTHQKTAIAGDEARKHVEVQACTTGRTPPARPTMPQSGSPT